MIAPSPHTTSFFDLQKPQVLLLMNLDLLECSLCNNWNNHQVLDVNLDLDSSICVYEGKHLSDLIKDSSHNLTKTLESFWVQNPKSTKEAHSYLSKSLLKTCLRFSLYTHLGLSRSRFISRTWWSFQLLHKELKEDLKSLSWVSKSQLGVLLAAVNQGKK